MLYHILPGELPREELFNLRLYNIPIMKFQFPILPAIAAALLTLLPACGGNKKGEKMKADYSAALNDSIKSNELQITECENRLKDLTDNVNVWLRDFTPVNNPREVEGYSIYNGWQDRYPLQKTGLIARISENEQLELIAALSGGQFTSIKIETPTEVYSDTVPHDQALNYKRDGLNTVMFSGARADSIAKAIADNELNTIKVVFIENGPRGSWTIPEDYKKMIAATWMLYSTRREQIRLEGRMKMLHEKINLLRAHIDKAAPASGKESE